MRGSCKEHFLFCAVSSSIVVGTGGIEARLLRGAGNGRQDTLKPILKRTVWSLNLALAGRRPSREVANAAGYRLSRRQEQSAGPMSKTFALTEVKGDWDWHVKLWAFWKHYWKCGCICFKCPASRIPRLGDGNDFIPC